MWLSAVSDVATHTVIMEASTCTEMLCAYPARAVGDLTSVFCLISLIPNDVTWSRLLGDFNIFEY